MNASRLISPATTFCSLTVLLTLATSLFSGEATPITSAPLAPQEGRAGPLFEALPEAKTGISLVNKIDITHPLKFLYHSGFACGGVCVGDLDNDGLPDLLLLNGPGENKLYRNAGDFKFEDISAKAAIGGGDRWGVGGSLVDINNDGFLDVYICNYDSPNQLFINKGNSTFTESAKAYGLDIVDASLMPSFADYDGDGHMDMYLLTNRLHLPGGRPAAPPVERDAQGNVKLDAQGKPTITSEFRRYFGLNQIGEMKWDMDSIGTQDYLFRNNGNGTFTNVTAKAGIKTGQDGYGQGLSATWWDYNNDGLQDLYVANDFQAADLLYRNNGDGTFTDVIKETIPHTSWFSMGSDFADIHNTGRFDFFVGDMSATNHYKQKTTMGAMGSAQYFLEHAEPRQYMRNALYINTGTSRFMEAAFLSHVANSDWTWSVKFGDLDNDGRSDLFIATGMARNFSNSDIPFNKNMLVGRTEWDIYEKSETRREKCMAFRNRANFDFEDVGAKWGLDHLGMSYGAATADFNRDGNLDIVVARLDEPVQIYRNRAASGHRAVFKLNGVKSNKLGIGAVLKIETTAGTQMRMLSLSTGFASQSEQTAHFGLGAVENIAKLSVEWPSGHVQKFENLAADKFYTITEPDAAAPTRTKPAAPPPGMFTKVDSTQFEAHKEKSFNDTEFKLQSLLPNQLSQLGPGMAVGDVNGDGLEDLFVSGALPLPSILYLNKGGGKFEKSAQPAFEVDKNFEKMGAVFFDARGTGILDLYVASGSVEANPGHELFRGRLYFNDGKGNFSAAPEGAIPDLRDSTNVVVAGDFDRDSKLDLFTGGRVVPGEWPAGPKSHLLRNEGGKFVDVTDQVAPGLKNVGMVTSALWTDVDSDGALDLMLTIEFDSLKYFHNEGGKLVERTKEAGLADYTGWWNGLAGRDLNGDGHIDYVATNFGLNHKYHANMDKPTMVYYGNVDGTGRSEIVEAEWEDGILFPIRGKSCSSRAMPMLKEKFKTYKEWALAPLHDIYDKPKLDAALYLKATTLKSGVFMNDGRGKFTFKPLPRMAQMFPAYGCALNDVDGDGNADLYMVGNFFGPQVETGRMDGGLTLLLTGNGDGTFKEIWPKESGFVVPGDSKSLVTLDLNADGWPDFIVGKNDERPEMFINGGSKTNRNFNVRLEGAPGNPQAFGARVTLTLDSGKTQSAEVYGGSGYLSQSSSVLYFGRGQSGKVKSINVTWPGGEKGDYPAQGDANTITIKQAVKAAK